MKLDWHWRPRLHCWQLVSDKKRGKMIKGKLVLVSGRVELEIYRVTGSDFWEVKECLYSPSTRAFDRYIVDPKLYPHTELAALKTRLEMKVRLKG